MEEDKKGGYITVYKDNFPLKVKHPLMAKCFCLLYWCNNCYFYHTPEWKDRNI